MSTSATTPQDVVKAAASIARDVTSGALSPADVDGEVERTCLELIGTVIGPEHSLWSRQVDIARAVIAVGGIPDTELGEWQAVLRRRREQSSRGVTPAESPAASLSGPGNGHLSKDAEHGEPEEPEPQESEQT